ncbi:APC family permease [Paramicrobacterium agarici]|uniref:APC family permease n=1 Tax=Paramicrobacterium agarici TaxID=630514 RepID=UPI0011538C1B|nr:APC family permease [Microbacterium agarici]TQO23123.1 amino acid/polyamine/organocation transporter (APC superfamily) [Microbacterium agarici]
MTTLARRLGLADAVVIGLGSMIGAGIFAVFGPAAQAAGSGLLVGLAIAAIVAFCNATSSAQLAAQHPVSGGTYAYGRAQLGPWWGFAAGWCFLIGKTASTAAMALTFAAYAAPTGGEKPIAALAVAAVAIVNLLGVTRTAMATRVIVIVVLACLGVALIAANVDVQRAPLGEVFAAGPYGVLQAAALIFFAFAGYARIATMGEEVRDPARTIPRAIVIALAGAFVVYAFVAVTVLTVLGPEQLASTTSPLADAVPTWARAVVRIGAAAASLGALLALMAGIGRTGLAMAREGDLPRPLAAVHERRRVPHRIELVLAAVSITLVLTVDLRGAIGFSSFGVLLYYFIANVSAWTQTPDHRRYPKWLQGLGMIGCLVLAAAVPWQSLVAGAAVLVIGVAGRMLLKRRSSP